MKKRIEKSGIYTLLLLYCFAILPVHAGDSFKNSVSDFDQEIDLLQEPTAHFDVQLKSSSEKHEKQKRKLTKLVFLTRSHFSLQTEVFLLRESQEVYPHSFSLKNMLFPYHVFW